MASSKTDLVVGLVMLDKFSKTFDKFNKDLTRGQSASKAFSNALGGIGVGLSVAAIGSFGMSSVKAYGDALQSQQRLMDAFAKQPQLMGYNVQALMEYNKTLSTKIAYDDDEINAAQANLALFKLTGDQIKSLTPLVADLARRKGIDLASAATSVGKAMQGQARGLKDLGITFKATGNTAADYATITALLNQQVGGTAEAFAQGNPLGQLENTRIAFQNMQESIGKGLLPAMQSLTNILTPLANLLGAIPTPLMQIGLIMVAVSFGTRRMNAALMEHRAAAAAAAASAAQLAVAETGGFGAIGRAGAAAISTSGAMRVLTAAQTTAAAAGRGLMAALGGPWGIAILAATTAVSLFMTKQDEASTPIDNWTSSLERQNGALTENSKAQVVNRLATDGVLDSVTKLGISIEDYTAAVFDGGDARQKLIDDLRKIQAANKDDSPRSGIDRLQNGAAAYTELGSAAKTAADALGSTSQMLEDSARFSEQAAAATGAVGNATAQTTAQTIAYNNALKVQIATQTMMAPALAKVIAALYAPKRDVAGGESIEAWLIRYTEYMQKMGLTADTTAPAVQDVTSSVDQLAPAAQRALDKANALGEALKSITAERDGFVASINDASLSFTSIFGFDIKGGVAASQAVTDALQAQAEARAALAAIGPGNDDARAKAQQDLAAATRDVADAEAESVKAQATGGNVLNSYKGRLAKLQKFSRVMALLAKKGLSALIYQDILSQGVDGGLEMANAINGDKALIGQLNTTADSIARSTAGMATRAGNYVYGGYVNDAQRRADRGAAAATAAGTTPDKIEVVLKLDSATVYKQLLRLKRERGGQSLGV